MKRIIDVGMDLYAGIHPRGLCVRADGADHQI